MGPQRRYALLRLTRLQNCIVVATLLIVCFATASYGRSSDESLSPSSLAGQFAWKLLVSFDLDELSLADILNTGESLYKAGLYFVQGDCSTGLTILVGQAASGLFNSLVPGSLVTWADAIMQYYGSHYGIRESLNSAITDLMQESGLASSLCARFKHVFIRSVDVIDWEDWLMPSTAASALAAFKNILAEEFPGFRDDIERALAWILDAVSYATNQPDVATLEYGARIAGCSDPSAKYIIDGDIRTGWRAQVGDWVVIELDRAFDMGWFCEHQCCCDIIKKTSWFVPEEDEWIGGYALTRPLWTDWIVWHSRMPVTKIRIEIVSLDGCMCEYTIREVAVVPKD